MLDLLADAIGPLAWMIPCMNVGLAATLVAWSYQSFPTFAIATVLLLATNMSLSMSDSIFEDSLTWDGTSVWRFGIFIAAFSFPIVAVHAPLLLGGNTNNSMKRLWLETFQPWKLIATQILRLAGSIFLLLAQAELVPSLFGWHTGVLDVSMGVTAWPLAALVYSKGFKQNRWVLYAWNIIGLYDFLWALLYIFMDYCGWIHTPSASLSLMGFHTLTLLATYQVSWAFALHVFFLTNMAELIDIEEKKKNKQL